jgi:hypothetical protein
MITMGPPYFVWINTNEIISSWYLLGAVCVTPPAQVWRRAAISRALAAEPVRHRAAGRQRGTARRDGVALAVGVKVN